MTRLHTMMSGKLHRVRCTSTHVDYEGSISVDGALLRSARILPNEQVHVYNVNTGARWITYAIEGEEGSGVIAVNGAAARLAQPGDALIVVAFVQVDEGEARVWVPSVVHVDTENRLVRVDAGHGVRPALRVVVDHDRNGANDPDVDLGGS